jgi:hypothetical protein
VGEFGEKLEKTLKWASLNLIVPRWLVPDIVESWERKNRSYSSHCRDQWNIEESPGVQAYC